MGVPTNFLFSCFYHQPQILKGCVSCGISNIDPTPILRKMSRMKTCDNLPPPSLANVPKICSRYIFMLLNSKITLSGQKMNFRTTKWVKNEQVYLRVLFWVPYHILLKNENFKYPWGEFSEIIENIIWFKCDVT